MVFGCDELDVLALTPDGRRCGADPDAFRDDTDQREQAADAHPEYPGGHSQRGVVVDTDPEDEQ